MLYNNLHHGNLLVQVDKMIKSLLILLSWYMLLVVQGSPY